MEIYDLAAGSLARVENVTRVMERVTLASGLRDGQPYVVIGCPTQSDAIRVQHAVAEIDPTAILLCETQSAGESQEVVGP